MGFSSRGSTPDTPIQKLRVVSAADINCPFHDPMKAGSSGVEICMKPNAQLAASKKKLNKMARFVQEDESIFI